MPYTVTEYAGGHGEVLATFASANDAVCYAMFQTVKAIRPQPGDPAIVYQGATSHDDDAPWLVVEAVP